MLSRASQVGARFCVRVGATAVRATTPAPSAHPSATSHGGARSISMRHGTPCGLAPPLRTGYAWHSLPAQAAKRDAASGRGARQGVLASSAIGAASCRGLVTVVSPEVRLTHARSRRLRRRVALWWVRTMGRGRRGRILTDRQSRLIANTSFVIVTASFMTTDILELRVLSVLAGALMQVFNAFAMERPLWISRS
jgi:hypothetical protein